MVDTVGRKEGLYEGKEVDEKKNGVRRKVKKGRSRKEGQERKVRERRKVRTYGEGRKERKKDGRKGGR